MAESLEYWIKISHNSCSDSMCFGFKSTQMNFDLYYFWIYKRKSKNQNWFYKQNCLNIRSDVLCYQFWFFVFWWFYLCWYWCQSWLAQNSKHFFGHHQWNREESHAWITASLPQYKPCLVLQIQVNLYWWRPLPQLQLDAYGETLTVKHVAAILIRCVVSYRMMPPVPVP